MGGDHRGGEVGGELGEVDSGDVGELFFDELKGAEVEGLDVGAGFHVGAGDEAAERGDEGLGIDGVWLVVGSWSPVGLASPPSGNGRILVSRLK